METDLVKKIDEKIDDYFPGKGFTIYRITKVKTKPRGYIFNILLINSEGEHEEIYVKKFGPDIQSGIHDMLTLKEDWGRLLTPKIIDYFEEDNVLLLEGVDGETLSKNFIYHFFGLGGSSRRNRLLECARKIGSSIGYLQRSTLKENTRVGDLNIYLVERFESEKYVEILGKKLWAEMQPMVEKLKAAETKTAQFHGDPSPHNILIKGDDVFLLDFCYQTSSVYLDPVLFMVYLDLVSARLPLINSTINQMKSEFLEAYIEATGEQLDKDSWDTFEFLIYLHILHGYNTRSNSLKEYIVASVDRKYINNKIRDFSKNVA